MHILPGKPQKNTDIEHENRTVRTQWLGRHHLKTIDDIQDQATR